MDSSSRHSIDETTPYIPTTPIRSTIAEGITMSRRVKVVRTMERDTKRT